MKLLGQVQVREKEWALSAPNFTISSSRRDPSCDRHYAKREPDMQILGQAQFTEEKDWYAVEGSFVLKLMGQAQNYENSRCLFRMVGNLLAIVLIDFHHLFVAQLGLMTPSITVCSFFDSTNLNAHCNFSQEIWHSCHIHH